MHLYRFLSQSEIYNIVNEFNLDGCQLPAFAIDTKADLDRIKEETAGQDLLTYKPTTIAINYKKDI